MNFLSKLLPRVTQPPTKPEQEQSAINQLAPELLKEILSKLPSPTVKEVGSVCRFWKAISDDIETDRIKILEKCPQVDEISFYAWSLIMKRKFKDGTSKEMIQKNQQITALCCLARKTVRTEEMHTLSRHIVALGGLFTNSLQMLERMQELALPNFVKDAQKYNPYAEFLVRVYSIGTEPPTNKKIAANAIESVGLFNFGLKRVFNAGIADANCLLALNLPSFLSNSVLKQAAENGSALAHLLLGGKEHIRKAAEGGIPYAQFLYGKMLLEENSLEENSVKEALAHLEQASLGNIPCAQFLIGRLIASENNEAKATKLKIAQAGLPLEHVEFGELVDKLAFSNSNSSLSTYMSAQYQSMAFDMLKEFYKQGIGVASNLAKATQCEQEAAKWRQIEQIPFKELPDTFGSNFSE